MNAGNSIMNSRKHLVFLFIFVSSFFLLPSPATTTTTFHSDFPSSSSSTIIYNPPTSFSGNTTNSITPRFSSTISRFSSSISRFSSIISRFSIFMVVFILQAFSRRITFKFPCITSRFLTSTVNLNPLSPSGFISPENHTPCGYLNTSLHFNENHISLDIHSLNSIDSRTWISFTSWIDHKLFLTPSHFKPEDLGSFQELMSLGYSALTEGRKETHSIKNWNFKSFGIKLFNPRIYKPHCDISINTVPTWFPDDHRSLSRCNNYCKKIDLEVSGLVFIFADLGYMSVKRCREIKKELSIKAQVARNPREFSYKELKIAINEFRSGRVIGQGSFRTVYNIWGVRPREAMDMNIAWYTYLNAQLWQDCRKQSEIDSWLSKGQYYSSPAGKLWESENDIALSQHVKYSSNYEQAMDKNIACYTNLNAQLWQNSRQQSEIDSWQSKNHYISPAGKLWERSIASSSSQSSNPELTWFQNEEDTSSNEVSQKPLTRDKVEQKPKIQQKQKLVAKGNQIWSLKAAEIAKRLEQQKDIQRNIRKETFKRELEKKRIENALELQLNLINMQYQIKKKEKQRNCILQKNQRLNFQRKNAASIHGKSALKVTVGRVKLTSQDNSYDISPAGKPWERSIASSSSQSSNPELTWFQNEEDTSSNEVNQKPLTCDIVNQKPKIQQKQKQVAKAMDKNYAWCTNFNPQIWQDSRPQSETDSWQSKKHYNSSPAWENEESENENEEPAWSQHVNYSSNYEQIQAAAAAMDKNYAWYTYFNAQIWQDSRPQIEIVSWQSTKHYSSPAGKLWERSIASSSSQSSNSELTWFQNEEDTSSNEVDQKPKIQQKQKQVAKVVEGNRIWSLKAAEIAKRREQEKETQRNIRKEAFKRELEKKRIENALELQLNVINMQYEINKREKQRTRILQKNQRLNFQRKNDAAIARKSEKIIKQKATSIHGKSALKVTVGRVKLTSQENSYNISPYEYIPSGRKFVPSWASENRVAMVLPLQQELNPESIFYGNSFCSIDEVLPWEYENQPLINDYGNPIDL